MLGTIIGLAVGSAAVKKAGKYVVEKIDEHSDLKQEITRMEKEMLEEDLKEKRRLETKRRREEEEAYARRIQAEKEAYARRIQAENEARAKQEAYRNECFAVKCYGCGAMAKIRRGQIVECEYCGNRLKGE